jgi:hypothetical protein
MNKTKQDIENIIDQLKIATDDLNQEETDKAYVFIEALSQSPARLTLPNLIIDSDFTAYIAKPKPVKPVGGTYPQPSGTAHGSTGPTTGEIDCPNCGKTIKITLVADEP